jgi:hypothetical protein
MLTKAESSIRNPVAIREALRSVCEKNELLLLVTPYIRFESNFLRLEQEAVYVSALMSKEDAMFGLRSPDLRMRFPFGHQFFEAATKLQGVGMTAGRQSLSLAIPSIMVVDDYRAAYRVERVGRINATFSSRRYDLLLATVVNISTTGVRIFSQRDFEDAEVLVEDVIHISITVSPDVVLNCKAKVRYVKDRILGLEFRPRLDGPLLDAFARWVFQKQEEELILQAGRGDSKGVGATAAGPNTGAPSLVLVSHSEELEAQLRDMLKDMAPLRRVHPATQSMKDLATSNRTLVLFHAPSLSSEDRKRIKILLDSLPSRVPFVLLGTDVDSGALFELGTELKAVNAYALAATSGTFFPRLLQGILRKHFPET